MNSLFSPEFIVEHFKIFCRFCMQNNKGKGNKFKHLIKNEQFCSDFLEIFRTELSIDEHLPANICNKCYRLLNESITFHKKSLSSFQQLREIKLNFKQEKVEIDSPSTDNLLEIDEPSSDNLHDIDLDEPFEEKPLIPKVEPTTLDEPKPVLTVHKEPAEEANSCVQRIPVKKRKGQQCTVCGKVVQRLDNHMRIHIIEKQYICHFCGVKQTVKSNLQSHILRHLKIKEHKCSIEGCGKDFITLQSLKKHLVMHSGSRNHKCDTCGTGFNQPSSLKAHILQVHLQNKKHMCELCDLKFFQIHSLRNHMRAAHGERPKCPICSRPCKTNNYLEIHMRTHSTTFLDYACKICGKACADNKSLLQHHKCHNNPKGRNHITCMKIAQQKKIGIFK